MCNPTLTKAASATNGKSSKTISPTIPSGFNRRKIPIGAAMLGLVALYNSLNYLLKDSNTWLRPADEFCENEVDGKCSRSDLFAFQAASAVMQLYMGGMGYYTWHKLKCRGVPQTPEGRLFGYLEEADKLLVGIFVYQTYDFFASVVVPEHNTWIFLGHHALASFTAWMSLEYQMVHYYAVFFGGCSVRKRKKMNNGIGRCRGEWRCVVSSQFNSAITHENEFLTTVGLMINPFPFLLMHLFLQEISTMFLVLCDFDVYFPAEDRGSTWGIIISLCQVSFTFTFLYYRVIGWWQVSFGLWSDILAVRKKGVIEHYRPGKTWFLYAFLVMDTLLGSLQLYWFFFVIVPKILEIVNEEN